MRQEPKFDDYQFAGKKTKAVSAETHLSYQDFGGMHVHRRKAAQWRRLETPAWALQDSTLRQTVLCYLEGRLYLGPAPEGMSDTDRLARIDAESKRRLPNMVTGLRRRAQKYGDEARAGASEERLQRLQVEVQNSDSEIMLHKRGLAATVIAVAYQSYRLGWNSVQVSQELNLRPPAVRMLLYRLNHVGQCTTQLVGPSKWAPEKLTALFFLRARGLTLAQLAKVFDTDPNVVLKHWNKVFPGLKTPGNRRGRKGTKYVWTPERVAKLVELRQQGQTWSEVAFNLESTITAVTAAARHYEPSLMRVRLPNPSRVPKVRVPKVRVPKPPRIPKVGPWPPERVAKLVELRQQGMTWEEVGLNLGEQAATVYFAAKRNAPSLMGFRIPRRPHTWVGQWAPERIEKLVSLRQQGLTWCEVAANLGVKQTTVWHAARRHAPSLVTHVRGSKKGVAKTWTAEQIDKLFSLRAKGYSWREVGFNFGIAATGARAVATRYRTSAS